MKAEGSIIIYGFVIMPNHIHSLLYYAGGKSPLNTIVGNGKRFMAYEIVNRLERTKQEKILKILKEPIGFEENKKGKKHEVWMNSFDAKECRTEKFILQKLNYIHNNPCSGKWSLADSPLQYYHSSASYYISGRPGPYPVVHYYNILQRVSSQNKYR